MFAPVYLDHNATSPADPAVVEAMLPYLSAQCGNASSRHEYGRAARRAIDEARSKVAAAVGAHASEVVFASGGSEANNLLIKGAAACLKPGLLAVSSIEHPCVIRPAEQLRKRGWTLHRLAVDADGRVDRERFAAAMVERPQIVSVMLANNETGVVQDVESLATQARAAGAGCFHTDAVQAVGKIAVDFRRLNAAGVHALTLSAHKLGGPKGAAALVLDKRLDIEPLIAGGGHERGLRSGTENVAAIVGFGVACELAMERLEARGRQFLTMRGQLELGLVGLGATLFGQAAERLPNTVYFAFPELDGETLVGQLDRAGYAVASGAACSSANPEPSHVLQAMGVAPELARGAVRVSLGGANTVEEVDGFLAALQLTVLKLQQLTAMAV
ncbi:cysteine desulfurase family protein [Accumulibacter sp.]|uniref:cysteine desulfurase family protein n=1 Tax=Accumulibacter sp. TaxID=2053492 RepID=UPI0028C42203|nr:cysteine desulfurase family protein [Accumulibacter sp.]